MPDGRKKRRWGWTLLMDILWTDRRKWLQTEIHEISFRVKNIYFSVKVVKQWHRLPRVGVESLSLEILKSHWMWTWTTFSSWSCWKQGAWTTGTFQPPPFYGSATLGKESSFSCPLSSNSCVFQDCFPVSNEQLVQKIPVLQIIILNF